ncbi:MAG: hypothetical protein LBS15_01250 [Endomicrobium sp.]|nr:hypothetical protein [Endomicrobium sp.]
MIMIFITYYFKSSLEWKYEKIAFLGRDVYIINRYDGRLTVSTRIVSLKTRILAPDYGH